MIETVDRLGLLRGGGTPHLKSYHKKTALAEK